MQVGKSERELVQPYHALIGNFITYLYLLCEYQSEEIQKRAARS